MSQVALLTVHGMGEAKRSYASPLLARLRRRLSTRWRGVSTHSVYYKHILGPNEEEVWKRVNRTSQVHYGELRRFLLFGLADAAGLEHGKEHPDSVYVDAQVEIAMRLLEARRALGGDGPVVAISHSLGCQVLSNYLYDAQSHAAGKPVVGIWRDIDSYARRIAGRALTPDEKRFLGGATLRRWLTTGCNIPIFVAAHKAMTVKPIAPPPGGAADFEWLNLYDPDDVLGWPLRPLMGGYETLVEDRAINSGQGVVNWIFKSWNPLSHTTYWTDDDVLEPLQGMLEAFL